MAAASCTTTLVDDENQMNLWLMECGVQIHTSLLFAPRHNYLASITDQFVRADKGLDSHCERTKTNPSL